MPPLKKKIRKIFEIVFQIITVGLFPLWKLTEIIGELLERPIERTHSEVAEIIDRYLTEKGNETEFGDFLSYQIKDPELEKIRRKCRKLIDEYPPDIERRCTNKQGEELLKVLVNQLRGGLTSSST